MSILFTLLFTFFAVFLIFYIVYNCTNTTNAIMYTWSGYVNITNIRKLPAKLHHKILITSRVPELVLVVWSVLKYYVILIQTRSSADADKPAWCVYRSVKVTKHGTIPYVRCFLLVCYSNFVPKMRRFFRYSTTKCEMSWPSIWVRGHSRSLKVLPFDRLGMVS